MLPLGNIKGHGTTTTLNLILRPPYPYAQRLLTRTKYRTLKWRRNPVLKTLTLPRSSHTIVRVRVLSPRLRALASPRTHSVRGLNRRAVLTFRGARSTGRFVQNRRRQRTPQQPESSSLLGPKRVHTRRLTMRRRRNHRYLAVHKSQGLTLIHRPKRGYLSFTTTRNYQIARAIRASRNAGPISVDLFNSWAMVRMTCTLARLIRGLSQARQ